MSKDSVKHIFLYRWRFVFGYSILALMLIGVLTSATLFAPGGLTPAEQNSALTSASLSLQNPESLLVVDLPYHALQKASIAVFGVSSFSIKLPSLLLAIAIGVGFTLLLRRWFTPSVSVITGSLAVVSAAFIFLAQQGTPAIMTVFWPVFILLLASLSFKRAKSKLTAITVPLLGIAAGLSLYTPMNIFLLLSLAAGSILHPHIRYSARKYIPKHFLALAILLGVAVALPLAYLIYREPSVALTLAITSDLSSFNIVENLKLIALQLFDITGTSINFTGAITPFITLPSLLLALLGVFHLVRNRHGAQNYLLTAWMIMLLPIVVLNPHRPELLFVPLMLLGGIGIANVLHYWYSLFPFNPYARAFGLVPLAVFVGGVVFTDSLRYFQATHYNSALTTNVSKDLSTIKGQITDLQAAEITPILAVSEDEEAFYQLYNQQERNGELTVTTTVAEPTSTSAVIATRESEQVRSTQIPTTVLAESHAGEASDRIYLYKTESDIRTPF